MVSYKNSCVLRPGDIIVDRAGNEMVIVEILNSSTGDCYALYNGELKFINAFKSSKIIQSKENSKDSK